jgi:hypothetical protein
MTRRGLFVSLLGALLAAPFSAVAADLRYGVDPRQTIEVHAPRGARRLPVVGVFGGGRGEARLLARCGFLVVLAGLRMAGREPRAVIADAAVATAWVADRARAFGGDATRLGVLGLGASADAALMLALDRRYLAACGRSGLIRASAALGRPPASARDLTATRPEAYLRRDGPPLWLGGRGPASVMLARRIEAVGGWAQRVVRANGADLTEAAAAFFRRELT